MKDHDNHHPSERGSVYNPDDPAPENGGVADLGTNDPREIYEPGEAQRPLSVLLIAFIGVFFAWAGYYTQRFSGNFAPLAYDERVLGLATLATNAPQAVDMYALGKRIYGNTCATCHQPDGQGLPGQYPPLAGSEWVLAPGPARMIRIVLDAAQGPITVKGVVYNNTMTAWRDQLNDQQIAAVITFVRTQKEWNHQASPVTPEEVALVRGKTKARAASGPWLENELLATPENEPPP